MTPPRWAGVARRALSWALVTTILLLVGACASPRASTEAAALQSGRWSGRLGLTVESEPPQQLHAGFELEGDPQAGRLDLYTPLGSTLAALRWSPGTAVLSQGGQQHDYESLDALAGAATGTALPVRALFAWLRGVPEAVDGWQVDLSQRASGRLRAWRVTPPPGAELRVILDAP
ncbi:MAG TPA: lipoprotein insertase outer membrane protein LolB [Ottowia sp.]|uniref:lipoprotein insertase outer membrane protein LolB n=1 Tax=Ottowia sp. TaxID=1898956 RepID=UPI002BAE9ABA|nr:lipoprotein insertase outer membrane protein LolB [Ottowia sp.]HMN21636.1 lipoprotein insertase outer membrane protein LolB [Ottowia sp.]